MPSKMRKDAMPKALNTQGDTDSANSSKPGSPMPFSRSMRLSGHLSPDSKDEYIAKLNQLQESYDSLVPAHEKLKQDLKKRNESYLRREVQYKAEISQLKSTLEKTVLCRGSEEVSMPKLRNLHQSIINNLDILQTRKDQLIEDHEQELLRQFRSRIVEYEDKLRREQTKQEDESGIPRAWVERTAMFARDVDKHKEQAIRLDRINEALSQRVDKYKSECKMREDDREYLVRQMVNLAKE
mmetsp:Transcript_41675/g.131383  ORF Transcript_41675/g.131383 Transcript_41675/m.131383 type:complete len:240 (-) Transcript_41675:668-1387(-)